MKLRLSSNVRRFVCVALLGAALFPSAAFAADSSKYFKCTVGWSGEDSASVVVGMASTNVQQYVDQSAAFCGWLISTGMFKAADKFYDYDQQFDRACDVSLNASVDAVVWTGSDPLSRALSNDLCSALQS